MRTDEQASAALAGKAGRGCAADLSGNLTLVIDASIAVKRLIQTKTMKQMLGQLASERTEDKGGKSIMHKPSNGRQL
jgi:hypothetical protein